MSEYLDTETWARRELFEFFRDFDKPYFNICTQLDVTNLIESLRSRAGTSVMLTYHYFALRAANEIEPFRYRLQDGKVIIYDVIHGGTTVMLPNENFTLAFLEYEKDFAPFIARADQSVKYALSGNAPFEPNARVDMIHCTTLPWVSFTSFAHARNWQTEDSVPKLAFGKFTKVDGQTFLPFSVEVHHALMDGLHVGRYVNRVQEMLLNAEDYMA